MPFNSRRAVLASAATMAVLASTVACTSATDEKSAAPQHPTSSCFWFGPTFSATDDQLNYAYPDTGALYWTAQFTMPAGSKLVMKGDYAHARYQSLNSYDLRNNAPTDAVNDVQTRPDNGSHNPYLPGAERTGKGDRSYTVQVDNVAKPAVDAAPNTLYAGVDGQQRIALIYRLYLPDDGRDITGGVGLPEPTLRLRDGREVAGDELCKTVDAATTTPKVEKLPLDKYLALRDQPGKPPTHPATRETVWRTFYNVPFSLRCNFDGQCGDTPPKSGGQYSNIDNNYVTNYLSREFGPVYTMTGTMPRTPDTRGGEKTMDGAVDMRYWSLCNNESIASTKVVGCVYDEQVPLDRDRRYTIVASLPQDRPANATPECGVAWIPLSPKGDGAGHDKDGYLVLRNMLPAAGFEHAVQNTKTAGDEKTVMAQYLPDGSYSSVADFETRGCNPA